MAQGLCAMSEDCMRHLVAENDGKLVVVGTRIQHPSVDKYLAILKLESLYSGFYTRKFQKLLKAAQIG